MAYQLYGDRIVPSSVRVGCRSHPARPNFYTPDSAQPYSGLGLAFCVGMVLKGDAQRAIAI